MFEFWVAGLLSIGALFAVIAAVGILRMPDFYMRISAASKASTLGATFILAATALYFDDAAVTGKIIAIIAFVILTTPVAAHMIGRAAHRSGVPLWTESLRDDLAAAEHGSAVKKEPEGS